MSFSISMPKTTEPIQFDTLLTLTRTAMGLGIGMLVADKIKHGPVRQAAALALLSIGALAAVPFLWKLTPNRLIGRSSGLAPGCARFAPAPVIKQNPTRSKRACGTPD